MGFIVKIGDRHFVKRTSRHGPGRGAVYCTDNEREARVWTRKADAEYGAFGVDNHRSCEWRQKYWTLDWLALKDGRLTTLLCPLLILLLEGHPGFHVF